MRLTRHALPVGSGDVWADRLLGQRDRTDAASSGSAAGLLIRSSRVTVEVSSISLDAALDVTVTGRSQRRCRLAARRARPEADASYAR